MGIQQPPLLKAAHPQAELSERRVSKGNPSRKEGMPLGRGMGGGMGTCKGTGSGWLSHVRQGAGSTEEGALRGGPGWGTKIRGES